MYLFGHNWSSIPFEVSLSVLEKSVGVFNSISHACIRMFHFVLILSHVFISCAKTVYCYKKLALCILLVVINAFWTFTEVQSSLGLVVKFFVKSDVTVYPLRIPTYVIPYIQR